MTSSVNANVPCHSMGDRTQTCVPGTCLFPFQFQKKKHTSCVPYRKGKICATKRGTRGGLQTYGYCPDSPIIQSTHRGKVTSPPISSSDAVKKQRSPVVAVTVSPRFKSTQKMMIKDLREELTQRGVDTTGISKPQLKKILQEHYDREKEPVKPPSRKKTTKLTQKKKAKKPTTPPRKLQEGIFEIGDIVYPLFSHLSPKERTVLLDSYDWPLLPDNYIGKVGTVVEVRENESIMALNSQRSMEKRVMIQFQEREEYFEGDRSPRLHERPFLVSDVAHAPASELPTKISSRKYFINQIVQIKDGPQKGQQGRVVSIMPKDEKKYVLMYKVQHTTLADEPVSQQYYEAHQLQSLSPQKSSSPGVYSPHTPDYPYGDPHPDFSDTPTRAEAAIASVSYSPHTPESESPTAPSSVLHQKNPQLSLRRRRSPSPLRRPRTPPRIFSSSPSPVPSRPAPKPKKIEETLDTAQLDLLKKKTRKAKGKKTRDRAKKGRKGTQKK